MHNNKLSHFTDVLCDEICDSQPISLPSSSESQTVIQETHNVVPSSFQNQPSKHFGQSGNFRSIEEIDNKYRGIFTYKYFNLVQSSVIEDALYSDKSMVVCAPTGSGKTVVFEMAIVQLLKEIDNKNITDDFKIIYMAPVKALCTERLTEWYPKFTKLGLLCIEVTGDTDVEFPQLKPYRIIITTPEKWDMLTRRWKDHRGLVEVVKLFLIDEVHILNDQIRGPVLEAVVSRMKTIESAAQSSHRIEQLQRQYQGTSTSHVDVPAPRIRFIAISATVGNPEDVAAWLGTRDKPAVVYRFGDECRPVKLKRVVEGYSCPEGTSIFKFDVILNYRLWPIIQKYHNGKPTLIFCNTRKSVHLTAETLSREITVGFSPEQKSKLINLASTIKTKKIQSLLLSGVGCHHAGLLFEERHIIEQAFRNRDLPILVTTTTLAMGVNLPAHLVIIKNTQQYVNGSYQEYSISTVLQMVGRAGRPQFDTEATAVIMTRIADKRRYEALVGGSEPLQSYLHKRIAENLNSEAALRTVVDVAQCVQWLNSTFLSVRAARDPKRYLGLPQAAPASQISKKIEELCVKAMNGLATAGLISMDDACCISSTEAGRLMSVYYLDLETMKLIMKVEGSESLERLLWLICESHELSDMHLRVDERRCLNTLNRNNSAATIRFPMKGKINSRQMKLNCIIQAVLGCLPIPDPSLNQEAMKIIRTADRVCKCLVSYVTRPNLIDQKPMFFSAVLNSITLAKCITAQLWENSPYVSKQFKGIGPTFSTLLASAGKTNITLLEESHPRDLERIINKGAPAGNILKKQISLLPKYSINIEPVDAKTIRVQVCLLNQTLLADNVDTLTAGANHISYIVVGDSDNYLIHYSSFRDSNLISVYGGCIDFEVERRYNNEHKVMVYCISSNIVGIDNYKEYVFEDLNTINVARRNERLAEIKDFECVQGERKRKNPNGEEIAQSKEKKKRDNNLMQKIKHLKESFSKVTKDIKGEFYKTKELSDSLLQNILKKEPINNKKEDNTEIINCALLENLPEVYNINFASEDIDDEEISNILNSIENEISADKVEHITKSENNTTTDKNKDATIFKDAPQTFTNRTLNKNAYLKRKRNSYLEKNNFNFLDILEKNASDDSESNKTHAESGLSDTVKYQIDQYLQKVQDRSNLDPLIEIKPQTSLAAEDSIKPINTLRQKSYTDLLNESNKSIESSMIYQKNMNTELVNINNNKDSINNTFSRKNNLFLDYDSVVNVCKDVEILPNDAKPKSDYSKCIISNNCDTIIHVPEDEAHDNKNCVLSKKLNNDQILVPTNFIKNIVIQNKENISNTNDKNIAEVTSTQLNPKIFDSSEKYGIESMENEENGKNFDYNIKKYFYSTTHVNVISENNPKHRVQIIRKLKVDIDVTKIVYKENCEYSNNKKDSKTNYSISEIINDEALSTNNVVTTNISTSTKDDLSTNSKFVNRFKLQDRQNFNKSNNDIICTENEVKRTILSSSATDDLPMFGGPMKLCREIENIINPINSSSEMAHDEKRNKDNAGYTENSASDIIKKYKTKIASNKNNIELHENIKYSKSTDELKLQPVKPKKKYRISNLQNIKISLPDSLTFKEPSSNSNLKHENVPLTGNVTNNEQNCTNDADNTDWYLKRQTQYEDANISPCDTIKISTLDIVESTCNSPDLLIDVHKSHDSEMDINQSMFNPRTLLQCLSNDDLSEIIPPPSEYCDSGLYSPVMYKEFISSNIDTESEILTLDLDDNFNEDNKTVFETIDDPKSKEIETCVLSRYDSDTSIDENFYNYSMMRKNIKDIQPPFYNHRREKLNQFKFKGKNKLK